MIDSRKLDALDFNIGSGINQTKTATDKKRYNIWSFTYVDTLEPVENGKNIEDFSKWYIGPSALREIK